MKKTTNLKRQSGRPYIAYYRVSTDKQGIRGLGIKAQKTAVKAYLKDKYPPDWEFTEVESGKKNNRPELEKALALCKKEKGILIVAKLDRLSRDLHFITSLEKAKIKFICCDYPSMDNLQLHIMGSIAQWEREQISKRTKAALAELKKQGKPLGWNNPKIRAGQIKYWKKHKKKKAKTGENHRKPEKIKREKDTMSRADRFANEIKPVLALLKEQGLTLEQTAIKLETMKVKTRQGKTNWGITQVVRLQKRLGI